MFHSEYCDFKNVVRLQKKSWNITARSTGKILLSVKNPTGSPEAGFLSYDSIFCKLYLGEKKTPTKKQTKKATHNYIWLDATKWISVLRSVSTPTEPPSAQCLFLTRSKLVLQQRVLYSHSVAEGFAYPYRTVEKPARTQNWAMENFICQENELTSVAERV